jgi:hypothetical protein
MNGFSSKTGFKTGIGFVLASNANLSTGRTKALQNDYSSGKGNNSIFSLTVIDVRVYNVRRANHRMSPRDEIAFQFRIPVRHVAQLVLSVIGRRS